MINEEKIIFISIYITQLNLIIQTTNDKLYTMPNSFSNLELHKAFKQSNKFWFNKEQHEAKQQSILHKKFQKFTMESADNFFEKLHLSNYKTKYNLKKRTTKNRLNNNKKHFQTQKKLNLNFNKKKNLYETKSIELNFENTSFKQQNNSNFQQIFLKKNKKLNESKTLNPFSETKFNFNYHIHNLCGPWTSGRQTNNLEW